MVETVDANSILTSTKAALGMTADFTAFDSQIIMHINSVFNMLTQLGVGPAQGYSIVDDSDNWADFLENKERLNLVKSYMYLKVKIMFDPPDTSYAIDAMNGIANNLEWRINVEAEGAFDDTTS